MASNATLPADICEISNLNEVFNKTKALGIDFTTLVSKCPQVCKVAFGNGQADLLGVGVNAAYITFVGLATLLSLLRIYFLWSNGQLGKHTKYSKHMGDLLQTFGDMASVFTISIGVAMVLSSWNQDGSFYDFIYAGTLVSILWFTSLSAISLSLFRGAIEDITLKMIFTNFVYFWGITAPLMVILQRTGSSQTFSAAIREFSSSCKSYRRLNLWMGDAPDSGNATRAKTLLIVLYVKSGIITLGFFLGFSAFLPIGVVVSWWGRVRKRLKPNVLRVIFTLVLVFLSIISIGFTVNLQQKRNAMKSITGAEFQGNQWAFGQVMALFVWIPLLLVLWNDKET